MEQSPQSSQDQQITLSPSVILHNFIKALGHFFWIPLILAVLLGSLLGFSRYRSYRPLYTASATFSVRASFRGTMDLTSTSSYLNTTAAAQLAATFPYVISSDTTTLLLKQALGKDVINGQIQARSFAEAALFSMEVTSSDPEDAYDILCAIIRIYPQVASPILGSTRIEVLDRPSAPPAAPSNVNDGLRYGLKMGAWGLVLGLVLVFLLSLARKTIHSAQDLAQLVNVKCIAYVPSIRMKKRSREAKLLLTDSRVSSSFTESIRNLRLKTERILRRCGGKVMLITSTLPYEGKTTISANLALSLAAEGRQVVLVDGDLRKQPLKKLLDLTERSDGLLELLAGKADHFRLLRLDDTDLYVISGDQTTNNPHRYLSSSRLHRLLALLREKFEYVIIDTPPAGLLSDAAALCREADATFYVVRQDMANTTQVFNAIQSLDEAGAAMKGCILNRTLAGTTHYGYSGKYGSGYGYKSSYDYKSDYGRKRKTYDDLPPEEDGDFL